MPKKEVEENFFPLFSKLKENMGKGGNINSFEPTNESRERMDEGKPR